MAHKGIGERSVHMSSLFKRLADMIFKNTNRNSHGFFSGEIQSGDPKEKPKVIDKKNKHAESEAQTDENIR